MQTTIDIIGAGLAGCEAALQLANRGIEVRLYEMRPEENTLVHKTDRCAELVCSNSLKSEKPESAAGMLKTELSGLGSCLLAAAYRNRVAAGGALAVDREAFGEEVTKLIEEHPHITLIRQRVDTLPNGADAIILASGPLTSGALAETLVGLTGREHMAFYDAAAPIVMADSLNLDTLFCQSRYEDGVGDYLNAPFSKDEYQGFIKELLAADRVIMKDFETRELFQACQPIEEVARKGVDAPRFGTMKPVGLTDPSTGKRPWAALQLRAEDVHGTSYNLVGFQTNLTFAEQKRVFRMIPGLEQAEFARFGVMHRNTFIDAPRLLDESLRLVGKGAPSTPVFVAGQLAGTEGYCEAIMAGLHCAIAVCAAVQGKDLPTMPKEMAFGALLTYATNSATEKYQPLHVNFGIMEPLAIPVKNKQNRYAAYASRGKEALNAYCYSLRLCGLLTEENVGNDD